MNPFGYLAQAPRVMHSDSMRSDTIPENRRTASADVRLDARLPRTVDRRLRMLAILEEQPLSRVLSRLLDAALPPADELAARLAGTEAVA